MNVVGARRVGCMVFAMLAALAGASQALAAETWIVRVDMWGTPAFSTLQLERRQGQLAGTLDGDRVAGSEVQDKAQRTLRFTQTDEAGRESRYVATLSAAASGDRMAGSVDTPDSNNPKARAQHRFTAWRVPERPTGAPRELQYRPDSYSNTWDADRAPVLVLWPGDTVHTTTLDSGGVDEHGVTRALFGNPQTGPFFVAGAEPGDTLVVRLKRLALNRDYADSLDTLVGRALGASLVPQAAELGKPVRWRLDRAAGLARPEGASGPLAVYAVPVRPMLGGLGVAPGFGIPALSTGDTGRYGGNMDFNEVVQGNTVYLPVQQPGALLYLGDAHALQGDGETSQYALETSMEVSFSVELIKGQAIGMPRVESPTEIMVLGQAGSLDEALRAASTGLVQWLQKDYGLSLSQAAQVMGSAVRFNIANLAGRSVGVSARLSKSLLPASKQVVSRSLQSL